MAEIKGCEGVIALMKQIYEVLQEYEKQTDAMSNADLETLQQAVAALTARGLTAQVTQISVSRTKTAGELHLLMANNPVFLITRE